MKRAHRTVHRALWPMLTLAVGAALLLALALRPPPEPPAAAALENAAYSVIEVLP